MTSLAPSGFVPAQRKRYRLWPLRAVRDTDQPPGRREDEVFLMENCYAQDSEVGPLIVGRPGITELGVGGTSQLGTGSTRDGQLVIQFTKRSGTTYTVVIVGGKFYTYNWSTDAFTEVVSAANFATASITVSASARMYGVVFADTLVVSDGVNKPWTWDGTSGASGLTSLTNSPVIYGQPAVYYAKLFGIKNTARSTIVWSEEGTPNTGYEAGGYNNAWDLVQTSTEGLEAIAATDEALYVARANSITAISGPVSTDFKTSGTREAVSAKIGTKSPAAFQVIDNRVWFLDQFGRPHVTSGGEPTEIGTGARNLFRGIPSLNYPDTQMIDDPETGHVKLYISEVGKDYPNIGIWLDRADGSYCSKESGYELTRIGTVLDGTNAPTTLHVGGPDGVTVSGSTAGYVYSHNHPTGTIWTDGLHTQDVPVGHSIKTDFVGNDTIYEKVWLRGELSVLNPTTLSNVQLTFVTPNGESSPLLLNDVGTSGALFGVAVFGVDSFGTGGGEQKTTFQMRQRGRWCRLMLAHAEVAEQFALSEIALEGAAVSKRPGVM